MLADHCPQLAERKSCGYSLQTSTGYL